MKRSRLACTLASVLTVGIATSATAEVAVNIHYLKQVLEAPPTLSTLAPLPEDLGLVGAELGLQDTDNDAQRRSEEARARMARLRGEPEAQKSDAEVEEIDPTSRSNLLPDIDEINSSLDSDGKKEQPRPVAAASETTVAPRKGGFRSGFRLAVVLAVLALLLYVFAPQLSGAVPQLADPLTGYVEMVNSWRAGLNDLIQGVAASLSESGAADT